MVQVLHPLRVRLQETRAAMTLIVRLKPKEMTKAEAEDQFDEAVDKCRRLEMQYLLKIWAYDLPEKDWPDEYRNAVAEWDAARIARNKFYEVNHS